MSRGLVVGVVLAVGALVYVLLPLAPRRRRTRSGGGIVSTRVVSDEEIEAAVRAYRATHAGGRAACPVCGPRQESDAIFCSTCGRPLDVATASA